ncbi:autotransporter outer membrane beta-barrel domain-containing protein [Stenotrophomonas sp. JAI102]|uniref:autotransporter outer membrane beta-barrel domain-containing protein n=1 Tax=Stenotrophomonas sp. JAI102 TaxID=2723077 RepID=UPI0015C86AD9|nr:outer membrane autotransporter protein [Stenotrophomonas sp. JAI102]
MPYHLAIGPQLISQHGLSGDPANGGASAYLEAVQALSGLRLELVRAPSIERAALLLKHQQVDGLAFSLPSTVSLLPSSVALSPSFYSGSTVMVTRRTAAPAALSSMGGMRVGVIGNGEYRAFLAQNFPDVDIYQMANVDEMLDAVDRGAIDAALGVDAVLAPLARKRFDTRLAVQVAPDAPPVEMRVASLPHRAGEMEMAHQTFRSLPLDTRQDILERWLNALYRSPPTVRAVLTHYRLQVTVLCAVLLATLLAVTHAQRNARALASRQASAARILTNARVEGLSGPAILVRERDEPVVADITVRNGSTLVAGNGVLLEATDTVTVAFNVESSTLAGNIINGAAATTHVNLGNNASITGVFDNVTSATLAVGGRWQLAGDSDVGALTLNSGGTVALGDGTAFNTLTVSGDFVGAGGALLFNTVLGDDASDSDKLIIGGSTSGQTNVAVNNVGGAGAQTVNGIQLIQVGGASNGVFTLAGRAIGGQYEYFLHQGTTAAPTEGNWYLRSALPVAPDPCLADPTLPGCTPVVVPPDPDPCVVNPALPQCQPPIPVLRPEPGAYLANQAAATQMFGMRLSDRTGGTTRGLSERGAWARVSRNQADYGVIADQLSVNGDTSVLQVGTDLLSWGADSRGQFGVMLGGGRANNTVTSRETGYSAKGKVEGQAVGVYASWLQDPAQTTGVYVDAWAQYAQFKNTVQGDALAKERYDSDAKTASVEAGYSFKVVDSASTSMFLEPQLQLSYTDFSADRHVETNGTVIDGNDAGGLTSRVGVRLFGHANSSIGNRVQPFVAVNWIHGADDNSLRFDGDRLEGGLPKDRYEAKAGASLQLGQRWTAWGDMGLQKGQAGYRDVAGQIGLRASW